MLITVTQHDIDNGVRASPSQCMLALPMRRQTGKEWCAQPSWVFTGDSYFYIFEEGREKMIKKMDRETADKALLWDQGYKIEPFTFEFFP